MPLAKQWPHHAGGRQTGAGDPKGQAAGVSDAAISASSAVTHGLRLPQQSPLFHAEHAGRYDRQTLIVEYQRLYDCRLIVVSDIIFGDNIPLLEELLFDADPSQDLHMILDSPGGDGETAVRMVRSAQARCRELSVIVPDQAKSAGTILLLGAHHILMGPTSDLGPVDPQFPIGIEGSQELVSAKDIIAAVENAEKAVAADANTYPIHASLLSDVSALKVQQARSALARTDDLVEEALKSHPSRSAREVQELKKKLKEPLIDLPKDHSAVVGASDAQAAGLPVKQVDPASPQWQLIWRLYAKYLMLGRCRVYEAERASRIIPLNVS